MAVYTTGGVWELTNNTTLSYYENLDGVKTLMTQISGLANLRAKQADSSEDAICQIKGDSSWDDITDMSQYITVALTVDSDTETATFTIADDAILGETKVTVTTKKASVTTGTGDDKVTTKLVSLIDFKDEFKVGLDGTEELTYNATAGTATIVGDLTKGFTLAKDNKSATYSAAKTQQTLATITGLVKNAEESTIEFDEFDTTSGTVTLSKATNDDDISVLGTSGIKLTMAAIATNNKIDYNLALDGDYSQVDGDPYWVTKGTTATYQFDSPTGYDVVTTGNTANKEIAVTKAKTTTVATVSGLAANIKTSDDKTTVGIQSDPEDDTTYVAGLKAEVGTTEKVIDETKGTKALPVTVTLTNSNVLPTKGTVKVAAGKGYTAEDIPDLSAARTASDTEDIWVINGNTATLKRVQLVYYDYYTKTTKDVTTTDKTQIVATAQKDLYTLATIKGLDKDKLAGADLTYSTKDPSLIKGIKGIDATYDSDIVTYNEETKKWTVNPDKIGTLKINADNEELLGTANVTINKNDNFNLSIEADLAPKFSEQKWNLSGTTATLKGTIEAGYTTSDDGKTITYTKSGENQTLATVSGLKSGTRLFSDSSTDDRIIGTLKGEEQVQGISLGDKQGEDDNNAKLSYDGDGKLDKLDILISANVLGTSNVALKSTFYELQIDTDNTEDGLKVPVESDSADNQIGWHGSLGATAILKSGRSAYYTLEGTTIKYNKPTGNYNEETKKYDNLVTLATIKGLNKNITEDDITFDTDTGEIKLLTANAVSGTNITITNTGDNRYYLAVDESEITEPDLQNSATWSQSGTTATYTAEIKGGYKVNADKTAINYTADSANGKKTTLATISGLAPNLVDSDTGSISGVDVDDDEGTIKLSLSALNKANVSIKGNYKLKLDNDIPKQTEANQDSWVISGATATFKKINTDYYTLNNTGTTLTYTKPGDVKYNSTEGDANYTSDSKLVGKVISYATIKGLSTSKTLVVGGTGDKKGKVIGYYDNEGEFVDAIEIDTTKRKFTILDAGVLDYKTNVTLDTKSATSNDYKDFTIALDDDLAAEVVPKLDDASTPTWNVNRGTASYVGKIAGGYTNSNETLIAYTKDNNNATLASIAGLATSVTAAQLNDANIVSGDEITIHQNFLGTTNATLTTNIPYVDASSVSNYKFNLDYDVTKKDEAENEESKVWVVSGTTATYNSSLPTYYVLTDNDPTDDDTNNESNIIEYHGTGSSGEIVKLEGLKSGLEVKKDGSIKGISVDSINGGAITISANVMDIANSKAVSLTDMNDTDNLTFKLEMDESVPKPQDTIGFALTEGKLDVTPPTGAQATIYGEKTAGYTYSRDSLSIDYTAATKDENIVIASFTGLNPTLKKDTVDGTIDGIALEDGNKIVISKAALGESSVTGSTVKSGYTVTLGSDVRASASGFGWEKNANGDFVVYSGRTTAGYTKSGNNILYTPGGAGGSAVATITGLNATINDGNIDGISVDSNIITLSKSVLGTGTVSITGGDFSFNLVDDADDPGYVPISGNTAKWSFSNGTATYTEAVTDGYSLVNESKGVRYTPTSTITSTITNLSKENVSVDAAGSISGNIEFDDDTKTFVISNANALAHKQVKLTTKASAKGVDLTPYNMSLGSGVAAESEDPIWNKKNTETKATLTQKTASGYTLSTDGKTINYSSDPTTANLAVVTGLEKTVAAENGKITGLKFGTIDDDGDFTEAGTGEVGNVIQISKDVLTTTNVALGNSDKYTFVLDAEGDDSVPTGVTQASGDATITVGAADSIWAINGTTATYKAVQNAFYTLNASTGKAITYNKTVDKDTIVSIKGLAKGLTISEDGQSILSADGEATVATIDTSNKKVTILDDAAFGTTNVEFTANTSAGYSFALDDNVTQNEADWKAQTEWVTSGTTATYKTYDKAHYELAADNSSVANRVIKFNKEGNATTYATVSGIKKDVNISNCYTADDDENPTLGGKIELGADQLGGAKVSLNTKGDFALALGGDAEKSEITDTTWTTNKTTATLKGTIGKGYALSEDAKTINYYSAEKTGQTIATVSGIKNDAKITDSDVTTDTTNGYNVIKLSANQLGTTKVTVKGDYYKLDVDNSAKSETEDPEWIKAANSTTATYTQKTYDGFTVADAGKTLNYLSKSTSVNLITLGGLNKTLTADDSDFESLVSLDDNDKTVTVSKAALTNSNVTLGKNDEYSLKLDSSDDFDAKELGTHWSYNSVNGATSLIKGKTEGWEQTNSKLITYTRAVDTVVAQFNGFAKGLEYNPSEEDLNGVIGGVSVADSIISLDETALKGISKITLTNKTADESYKLALANDSLKPDSSRENKWTVSGTNATLKNYASAGYEVGTNDTIITAKTESVVGGLATLTGLPKGLTADGDKLFLVDKNNSSTEQVSINANNEIEMTKALLDSFTGVATITSSGYSLGSANVGGGALSHGIQLDTSIISTKGTASVTESIDGGWKLSDNKHSLVHTASGVNNYATISGINKEYDSSERAADLKLGTSSDSLNITVGATALTTSNLTIKNAKDSSYKLVLGSSVNSSANASTKDNWDDKTEWVLSGGSANYKTYDYANYYTKDGKTDTIFYAAPSKGVTYATISGLKKDAIFTTGSFESLTTGTITLGDDQLNQTKVTLKITNVTDANAIKAGVASLKAQSGNEAAAVMQLALGDVSSKTEFKDEVWDTNGTTAKLTGTITKGYQLSNDKKTITYQAADKYGQVIFTVNGIKKDAKIENDDVTVSDDPDIKVIKLDMDQLGTSNVTTKGEGYKLALNESVVGAGGDDDSVKWENQTEWVVSGTNATYKKYDKEYYTINETGSQITYHKAADIKGKGVTYAQVSGIASGASIAENDFDKTKKILTLNESIVGSSKKVTLKDTNGDGYTLALGSDLQDSLSTADTDTFTLAGQGWVASKATGKLIGTQGAGYAISNDGLTATYSAAKAKQTIAQISGFKSADVASESISASNYNAESNTFTLSKGVLDSKVTIGGTAKFNFSDYDGSITGSSASDYIEVSGAASINALGGNDYIKLNGSGSRTFFYANGNGNDVIEGFTTSDVINITNVKKDKVSIAVNDSDAIVKVNSATIRLKGLGSSASNLKVNASDGAVSYATEASNILADDNYELTPQLSSIVNNKSLSYTADDMRLTQDATALTKQSAIVYSSKK